MNKYTSKIIASILVINCFASWMPLDLESFYEIENQSIRRVRGENREIEKWLDLLDEDREEVIARIVNYHSQDENYPRLLRIELEELDRLIREGKVKSDITPLVIEKNLFFDKKVNEFNRAFFGEKNIKLKEINFRWVDKGPPFSGMVFLRRRAMLIIVTITNGTTTSKKFLDFIDFTYLHEDGHLKAASTTEGEISSLGLFLAFINREGIEHPFLSLTEGFKRDFTKYLTGKNIGIFVDMPVTEMGDGPSWMGIILNEIFNNKMLLEIHGEDYRSVYGPIFYSMEYPNISSYPQVREVIEKNKKIKRSEVGLFLAMCIKGEAMARFLFNNEIEANKFHDLAMRLIKNIVDPGGRVNIDKIKRIYRGEYFTIMHDLRLLWDALELKGEYKGKLSDPQIVEMKRSIWSTFQE